MRAPSDLQRRFSLSSHRARWAIAIAVVVLIALVIITPRLASFYTGFLWFRSVHLSSVWVKTLTVEAGLGAACTIVLFGLLWGNLWLADRLAPAPGAVVPGDELVARWQEIAGNHMPVIRAVVAAAFALIGGVSAHSQWNNWLLFSNAKPFTTTSSPWKNGLDPLNHLNDGFYVFRLPFLDWVVGWAFSALVITLLLCLVAHYLNGGVRPHSAVQRVSPRVKAHLSVLLAVLALVQGVSYYLQRLSLVLSINTVVDGATYKDVHAVRPALILLIAIAVIAAGLFLYNVRQQGWLLPVVAVALWGLVWVLVANVYPALVQALVVNPAQNVKEAPYIADNITATTAAFGLRPVTQQPFQGNATVTSSQVTGHSAQSQANIRSLSNVPLLDPNLPGMNSVFTKQQGFRAYYSMSGPSSDRYDLAIGPQGATEETQVLVSARQLNSQGAPSSWVNQHLQYTHGYGAVVAPASQAGVDASNGYPSFTLLGVPPSGQPSLSSPSAQPRIYFDTSPESASGYVVANSQQAELDYEDPTTGNQISNHYAGSGGVQVGGFLRRLAFSISFGDYNLLISGQIDGSSRILYFRNVTQRLEKAAPFLTYDSDPYPVILNKHLYWVQDAYTTTTNFPYSEQANTSRLAPTSELANEGFNYIRNSVKAVVDAYSGAMWFFVQDPTDPIIQTYERAFPKLFTSMSKADTEIPGITGHWRYPEDMFTVQTNMYGLYHQQSPTVFYSRAQAWGIAESPASNEVGSAATTTGVTIPSALTTPPGVASASSSVTPIYELVALPGQTQQSFVLVQPFVPASGGDKQTLTAFMTASSDPDDYGALTVFTIPAGQTVDGPSLVSTAVQTNNAISEEISLLDQHGSKVELGSVVMTPIGQSLLYIQPLYVEQTTNGVPRLDDVIVVYNGTAYHSGPSDPSLGDALCQVANPGGDHPFASYCSKRATPTGPGTEPAGKTGGQTTTTTAPATTTSVAPTSTTAPGTSQPTRTTLPTPHGSLAQDLAQAQQYFALANAALKQGDLGTYQNDIRAAEAEVALADQLATATVTTTTVARHGATSTSASTTTTG